MDEDMMIGEFMPVSEHVKSQGGGAKGQAAVRNFITKVLRSGCKIDKFIWVHPWTQQLELAIPKRRWQEGLNLGLQFKHC